MAKQKITVRLISPSSRGPDHILGPRISELENRGFRVLYDPLRPDPHWPFTISSVAERADALIRAMEEKDADILLATRGGYGASDLFHLIPWKKFEKAKPKTIVGFSDISALHSAAVTKLGWPGIHAPMPQSELWGRPGLTDTDELLALLKGEKTAGSLKIDAAFNVPANVCEGWLFGGCLSVLTNLIGTPYLPTSLAGAVLFFEDIGENPGRLMRFLTQWQHAGLLGGVRAIVCGQFRELGPIPFSERELARTISERFRLPVFVSPDFGHCAPNYPLPLKARAVVTPTEFRWQLAGVQNASRV